MSQLQARATLEDLYRTEGKAELIGGRIVQYMATGILPSCVAANIYVSLRQHAKKIRRGNAYTDNLGYAVAELPSGRESFSPDTSYYDGPLPENRMRFVKGPPKFAVEVRSEEDYRPGAKKKMADKRADYFAAGTKVVWDVDPLKKLIHVYRFTNPKQCTTYRRGNLAEAEPAVLGWRIPVDEVFSQ